MTPMTIEKLSSISIGYRDDNLTQKIEIDISSWQTKYPELNTYRIEMIDGKNQKRIALNTAIENGCLVWTVTNEDTATEGEGSYQIIATGTNGEQKASRSAALVVRERIHGDGQEDAPEYMKPLLDQVAEYAAKAEASAERAESAAIGDIPVATSDIAGVVKIGDGLSVTEDGTLSVDKTEDIVPQPGTHGKDGEDGKDGGYYTPTVSSDGVLSWRPSDDNMPTVSPSNIKGDKGDKGERGEVGPKGDKGDPGEAGQKGEDGKDAVVDTTLTQEGQAADAKATGEAISQLSEEIGDLKESGVGGIEIDETLTKAGAAADAAATGKILQSHDLILNGAKNLYFESPFARAGYYEVAKGTYNGDSTATSTELLPTDGFYKIKAKTSIAQAGYAIAFFDADKKLLPEISKIGQGGSAVTYDVEIPGIAKYVVVSQYGSPPSPRTAELVAIPGGFPARLSAVETKAFAHAYIGAAFGSFRKWGVVGDSLSVGHTQDSGGTDHARNIYYSWPQYMARAYGNTCLNFGQSGATAKSWMSLANGYNRLVDAANLCQAYVVGLGANDAENLTNYTSGIGTAADINTVDSSGNADSFYGWYGKIISAIRAAAPQAKIFLFTLPYPRNTNANVPEINTAIGEIAEMFDNTVLVDLSADYNDYFKDSRIGGALVAGHFTAAGYANIAKINAMALSDVMNANPADYTDIPFIPYGTATELN